MKEKVKVLIVDDSNFIRQMFVSVLSEDADINVVGTAENTQVAREKIKTLNPDVVTLDIEMPGMNGIDFLGKIMSLRPMPVVMISSLTQRGAEETIKCLEMGAVDFMPKIDSSDFDIGRLKDELIKKVKQAKYAKVSRIDNASSEKVIKPKPIAKKKQSNPIFFVGSSTGGVEAIKSLLSNLPANFPPVLIVQHMPEGFTKSFANRLNNTVPMNVKEAQDGDLVLAGNVYIACGSKHMTIVKKDGRLKIHCFEGEKVSGHIPSVDVLFQSAAKVVGEDACGVILTGMGSDGAKGLKAMHDIGCYTIGQNEDSCVVYGMPKVAYEIGAVRQQASLNKIPDCMIEFLS